MIKHNIKCILCKLTYDFTKIEGTYVVGVSSDSSYDDFECSDCFFKTKDLIKYIVEVEN